ncbi:MAG: type II secretion system protein GspG [Magnetococcales bacterium]|nr:type II secretion system protein GspG [Magnetococcales bacterium]
MHAGSWLLIVTLFLIVFDFQWQDAHRRVLAMDKSGIVHAQFPPARILEGDPELDQWLQQRMAWFPVQPGMRLELGVRIRTFANATLNFQLADDTACRILERSTIAVRRNPGHGGGPMPHIEQGALYCRKHATGLLKETTSLWLETPLGRLNVTQAGFLLAHDQATGDLLEVTGGTVQYQAGKDGATLFVHEGHRLMPGRTASVPRPEPLSLERKLALAAMSDVSLLPSFWSRLVDGWPVTLNFLGRYHDLLAHKTVGEMLDLHQGMGAAAPFRWNNQTPERLRTGMAGESVPPDGWGNAYYYEKLGEKRAVLISFGRDGLLFTQDDIVLGIQF